MANKLALAGPGSKYKEPDAEPAGFWAGYWHGSIAPIAFLVSLFNEQVGIYETHNNGKWYDFGFVLGASSTIRSTGKLPASSRKPEQAATDSKEPSA